MEKKKKELVIGKIEETPRPRADQLCAPWQYKQTLVAAGIKRYEFLLLCFHKWLGQAESGASRGTAIRPRPETNG